MAYYNTSIRHDSSLAGDPAKSEKGAGYVQISDDPKGPLVPRHGQTLLFVLFYVCYTEKGRDLLRRNNPYFTSGVTEASARTDMEADLLPKLNNPQLFDTIFNAHWAACQWQLAHYKTKDADEENKQKHIYQNYLTTITWQLWEDGMDHEFSLAW